MTPDNFFKCFNVDQGVLRYTRFKFQVNRSIFGKFDLWPAPDFDLDLGRPNERELVRAPRQPHPPTKFEERATYHLRENRRADTHRQTDFKYYYIDDNGSRSVALPVG